MASKSAGAERAERGPAEDAGHVHQRVDPAELAGDPVDGRLGLVGVGEVGGDGQRPDAPGLDLGGGPLDRLAAGVVGQGDVGPPVGQHQGQRRARPAGRR